MSEEKKSNNDFEFDFDDDIFTKDFDEESAFGDDDFSTSNYNFNKDTVPNHLGEKKNIYANDFAMTSDRDALEKARVFFVAGIAILFVVFLVLIWNLPLPATVNSKDLNGMWMSESGNIVYFVDGRMIDFDMGGTYVNEYTYKIEKDKIFIDDTEYTLKISDGVLSMKNGKYSYPEYTKNITDLDKILLLLAKTNSLNELNLKIEKTQLEKTIASLQKDTESVARMDERLRTYQEQLNEKQNEVEELRSRIKLN